MGIFGTIFKTAIDVVTLPISVVKDVVTLGGTATDENSAIKEHLNVIKKDLDNITDK